MKHIPIELEMRIYILFFVSGGGGEDTDRKNCISTKNNDDRRRDNSNVYIARVFAPKCENKCICGFSEMICGNNKVVIRRNETIFLMIV